MNDSIPELKIEFIKDGTGQGLILLEQDSCGNIERVAIHPIHLRYMAEQFGLVNTGDPDAHKTIATLSRRLCLLRDRIDHLAQCLHDVCTLPAWCDLSYEQTYAMATVEIADEYCFEFIQQETASPAGKVEPIAHAKQGELL